MEALVATLTSAVRFLSVSQIAKLWCDGNQAVATEYIQELEQQGLVVLESHLVHPEFEVTRPEFVWSPGDPEPQFMPIAYRLRKRWSHQKQMKQLVFPGRAACEKYGGTRVRPRKNEISHDLHLGSVFGFMVGQLGKDTLQRWVSGDLLRSQGRTAEFSGNVPDAVLVDSQNSVETIIEGGGSYPRAKLEMLHREFSHLPYLLF